jgi:YidC/Oxa1 family membrane protein insertase
MDFKQLFLVSLFSFGTLFLFNYFFPPKQQLNQSEQQLIEKGTFVNIQEKPSLLNQPTIPTLFEEYNEIAHKEMIELKNLVYEFSDKGAVLNNVFYKKNNNLIPLYANENDSFLIAINDFIPLNFKLIKTRIEEDNVYLVYEYNNDFYHLTKTFIINKETSTINLSIDSNLQESDLIKIKITNFDSTNPYDPQEGFVAGLNQKIQKASKDKDVALFPSIAGLNNKYFVQGLTEDSTLSTERTFFTRDQNQVDSMYFEMIPQNQFKASWKFYVGIKDYGIIKAHASKLSALFDIGIFGTIGLLLNQFINFLVNLFQSSGIAIIVLAFLVRIILFFISWHTRDSGRNYEEFVREYKKIEQKYKFDPEGKKNAEEDLRRRFGSIPGLSKFMASLVQLFFFFNIRKVIDTSIIFLKAPFLWIPDLSSKDPYGIFSIIFIASLLYYLLSRNDMKPLHKLGGILLVILFGFFTYYWSAGLVLYFGLSAILGILQQKIFGLQ